jgi:uncharacterized metal-binding protein YceD (DUF177 family)
MNKEEIKIFIDRLVNEGEFVQSGQLSPSLLELDINEGVCGPLTYSIKAYVTDEHLLVTFDTSCELKLPCKICNEPSVYSINCPKQTHLEPLEDVKKGCFDAVDCIRETILLNIPPYWECEGHCKQREAINKFLKKSDKESEAYHPFQGL